MKEYPKRKVVIDKIPSVKDPSLQAKRDRFNSLVFAELVEEPEVSFVAHDNLYNYLSSTERHNSSEHQVVVCPRWKSRQTRAQFGLGKVQESVQTCPSADVILTRV